jgi:hypothetical protein
MYGDIKIKTHAEMDALNKIKKQLRRKRTARLLTTWWR